MKKSLKIKIISLGNAEVGKSCIIKKFCEKRFVPNYMATIGIDYGMLRIPISGHEGKVNFFDFSGSSLFYEARREFYEDATGAMLVYDVSNRRSFEALNDWLEESKREMSNGTRTVIFIVVANKVDKTRNVSQAEGQIWSASHGFPYFETSALNGLGITDMFNIFLESVVAAILNKDLALVDTPTISQKQAEVLGEVK